MRKRQRFRFFAQLHEKAKEEAGENMRESVEGQWQLMMMGLLVKASHAPHLSGVKQGCNGDNDGC